MMRQTGQVPKLMVRVRFPVTRSMGKAQVRTAVSKPGLVGPNLGMCGKDYDWST